MRASLSLTRRGLPRRAILLPSGATCPRARPPRGVAVSAGAAFCVRGLHRASRAHHAHPVVVLVDSTSRHAPRTTARCHRDHRRARAQPEGRPPGPAEERAGRVDGSERLGKVESRVRYALRGGAAALRGVALDVRASVPRKARSARGRAATRALANDRHRAEERIVQSAFDGRHHHGAPRLSARPLGEGGPAALYRVRAGGAKPERGRDRRGRSRAAKGVEGPLLCADRDAPKRRVPGALCGAPRARLRAGSGGRNRAPAGSPSRARQEEEAFRGARARSSHCGACIAPADRRSGGTRPPRGEGRAPRGAGTRSAATLLGGPRVLRQELPGTVAGELLVQLARGDVQRVQRPGHPYGDRSGPRRAGSVAVDPRGRDRPLGHLRRARGRLDVSHHRGHGESDGRRSRRAVRQAVEEAPRSGALRTRRQENPGDLGRGRDGEPRHVGRPLPGRHPEFDAAVSGDQLGEDARAVPEVPERGGLRPVQRPEASRREPVGPRGRTRHRGRGGPVRARLPHLVRRARSTGERP